MLRLDSLEITGFKSFADRTRIQLSSGITCIIGPNGCGKSNVADSIGWILGSQSAHSLRGERMEDVIFAGTRKRKPSGFVETTLTFSRGDGEPISLENPEYSGESLAIGRKLYRDGESIYSIQDRRSRLKDIHPLLEEAGLGFASYALIAQGRIGWFLSAKPLDRRTVIEEAAQIVGYKSRRRSAELKLEMARQNLLRVNDIISEIERQLRSLKRQAAKARRFRELKEEFRQVQRRKLVLESKQLRKRLAVLEQELGALKASEHQVRVELSEREQAYRKILEEKEELQAEVNGVRQLVSEVRLEVELTDNSIRYHRQQIDSLRKSMESSAAERDALAVSLGKVEEELSRFESERSTLDQSAARAEADIAEHSQKVDRCRSDVESAENQIEQLRKQLLQLSAETASLHNHREELDHHWSTAQSALERLEAERLLHARRLQEATASVEDTRRAREEKESESAEVRRDLEQYEAEKSRIERELEELNEEASEVNSQLIAQRERLQSLQEIELNHSQYSEGVQKFLTHLNSSQTVRAGGTLADFVETSPEFEKLVEEILDKELEYILVDSMQEAVQGISELKNLKTGKCTFLSLSSNGFAGVSGERMALKPPPQEGVFGTLGELLQMKSEVRQAFQRTLPERAEAVVVSDLNRAFELAHTFPDNTFITLSGESLTPSGLLSASAAEARKLGLLSLKRQKRELEKRVLQLQKTFSGFQIRKQERQEQLQSVSEHARQLGETFRALEKEMIGLAHRQEQREDETERGRRALQVVEDEIQRLEAEQQERKKKMQQADQELADKKGSQTRIEQTVSETQTALQQLKVEFNRIQEQFHFVASQRKVLEERRASLERTLVRIQEQRDSLLARIEAAERVRQDNGKRLQETEQTLHDLEKKIEGSREQEQRLAAELQDKEQQQARRQEHFPEAEKQLSALRDRKSEVQEHRSRLEVEQARFETQLENVSRQCVEQLQTGLEEAAAGLEIPDQDLEEISRQYADLKDRLERFGPINMTALQEYQEAEERYQFLTSQRQDIESSIADTTRAIQEINRRSREKFQEAFEAINLYFNEIFQKLFGGGECGMRLMDDDDLLESGIDIYAQPPGKKLQNVNLLSGGEKALTVFGLLMALFRFRPSRFCVLDEVDAPLDDANIARFTSLIREMSQQTQFIVITHNKKTMETADAILGVTMEEPGVSQVVSVKLEQV